VRPSLCALALSPPNARQSRDAPRSFDCARDDTRW
jgi:hypothetical protein